MISNEIYWDCLMVFTIYLMIDVSGQMMNPGMMGIGLGELSQYSYFFGLVMCLNLPRWLGKSRSTNWMGGLIL